MRDRDRIRLGCILDERLQLFGGFECEGIGDPICRKDVFFLKVSQRDECFQLGRIDHDQDVMIAAAHAAVQARAGGAGGGRLAQIAPVAAGIDMGAAAQVACFGRVPGLDRMGDGGQLAQFVAARGIADIVGVAFADAVQQRLGRGGENDVDIGRAVLFQIDRRADRATGPQDWIYGAELQGGMYGAGPFRPTVPPSATGV